MAFDPATELEDGGTRGARLPAPFREGLYQVRFAQGARDLDAALRLRFEVFNVELREGLSGSWATGRDEDAFDSQFHHLMVEDRATGRVVGTYRVQTDEMAAAGRGFYSADEFDLSALPGWVVRSSVELGRACIAREHRNRWALYALWRGLAAYLTANGKRILFGCSSITGEDPAVGVAAYASLARDGHVHPALAVLPVSGLECRVAAAAAEPREANLPLLFRTYLRFGGKVCGPPAIDRAFKTIDFFTLLDTGELKPDQRRRFF